MKIVSVTEDRNLCTTTITTEREPGDPPEPPTWRQRLLAKFAALVTGAKSIIGAFWGRGAKSN